MGLTLAAAVLGLIVLLASSDWLMLPDCYNESVQDSLHNILISEFHQPLTVEVAHIRTISGWIFGGSYACSADLVGISQTDEFGFHPGGIDYTVSRASVGQWSVRAKLRPLRAG